MNVHEQERNMTGEIRLRRFSRILYSMYRAALEKHKTQLTINTKSLAFLQQRPRGNSSVDTYPKPISVQPEAATAIATNMSSMSSTMSMDMGTATSSAAMPMATDQDMGGMGGMGDGCKISVRMILFSKWNVLTRVPQMLWNWNTIDSCKHSSCVVLRWTLNSLPYRLPLE
jgi:hypothetical protein